MKKLGLYIHIPFCVKKCYYCDFCSFVNKSKEDIVKYIDAVIKEIRDFDLDKSEYLVDSIYFGGGTPSSIDEYHIKEIMRAIHEKFNVDNNSENTIEINPGTITYEKALSYKKSNINRVSIGIQTFEDDILKKIGRIHDSKSVYETFEILEKCSFENISGDLMFNLPTQNIKRALTDLEKALELKIKHLSYYSLKIEENTIFNEMLSNNEIELLSDEKEREIYHLAIEIMHRKGMKQYEISNFSLPGFESKHNLKYWNREEYLGFGVSAHSFINETRFSNTNSIKKYISNIENNIIEYGIFEKIGETEKLWEYLMLGLRKNEGINIFKYKQYVKGKEKKYNEIFKKLKEQGLVEIDGQSIKLTALGKDLSNSVFVELI